MPISGPLRAVDTKVLGIDLETTPVHGSALDRYVVVSVDGGFGHAEAALEHITNEQGTVVRAAPAQSEHAAAELFDTVRRDRRSLDAVVLSGGRLRADDDPEERIRVVLAAVRAEIAALRSSGGALVIQLDLTLDTPTE
ncbi:hypothetical protein [Pseudonocardia sp. NPDC046786]|uniref:hypothetical protein n=1 Tax=Pseudonocardia sp. NPDC046786 TaxID=3155471 RepID=UPI0033EB0431